MKGGELALPPPIMLDFIDELKKFGILILGCDGWRYLKPDDPAWIVQDLSVDFSVDDEILEGCASNSFYVFAPPIRYIFNLLQRLET
jgi:hypothetical protein